MSRDFSDKETVEVTLFYEGIRDKIAYLECTDNIKQPVNIEETWRRGVKITMQSFKNAAFTFVIYFTHNFQSFD